jgi:hypothetical protein
MLYFELAIHSEILLLLLSQMICQKKSAEYQDRRKSYCNNDFSQGNVSYSASLGVALVLVEMGLLHQTMQFSLVFFYINNSQLVKLMTDDDMPNIATLFPSQNGSIC